jgi:uncharacterized protein
VTVELRPLGVQCNLQCHYCYQHPQRDAGLPARAYDLDRMKAAVLAEGRPFSLFGGEPLLVPKQDLEEIWKLGLEHFGRNTVQTNATLIDDDHIRLFREYRVHVGVSIDGPGPLNDARWFGTIARTRAATAKTEAALARLCAENLRPSVILTLHRGNAAGPSLAALLSWVTALHAAGVRNWRLHLLETEDDRIRDKYAMDTADNVRALSEFLALTREIPQLRIAMFQDMLRMLRGQDQGTTCTWRACDPYSTQAVRGVEGNGQRSNCGRTNKDGIDFVPAPEHGFERYLALHQAPDAAGGCRGCRFFLMCKGQCPGTAIDRDWRNKSEHCGVWKAMYTRLEEEMVTAGQLPLSLDPAREAIETALLAAWRDGSNASIGRLRDQAHRQPAPSDRPSSRPPVPETGGRTLPAFARIAWVSEPAQDSWQPRLTALAATVSTVEWLSVAERARPAAVVAVAGSRRADFLAAAAARGLAAVPLNGGRPAPAALPGAQLFAVGGRETARAVRALWSAGDDSGLGAALGYPPCCVSALCSAASPHRDGPWLAASPAADGQSAPPAVGPAPLNPLWWELGLTAIPHWACHPGCEPSLAMAATFAAVAEGAGLADDWRLLHEVLSWPAEWTALHGIAELKTPVLKLATATEVGHELWRAAWAGTGYPADGADGVRFPYRAPRHLPLTSKGSFRAGLRRSLPILTADDLGQLTRLPAGRVRPAEARSAVGTSSPAAGPLPVFVLDEFTTDEEIALLRDYAEGHPDDFHPARVGGTAGGRVDDSRRRGLVMHPRPLAPRVRELVTAVLPRVQQALGLPVSAAGRVDVQMTASAAGGFYNRHIDNSHGSATGRKLSYVLFVHRSPRAFTGGELVLYPHGPADLRTGRRVISPETGRIVFFPSGVLHEILPVRSPGAQIRDARLTVNGWIH